MAGIDEDAIVRQSEMAMGWSGSLPPVTCNREFLLEVLDRIESEKFSSGA
jgi:hypothetical protein